MCARDRRNATLFSKRIHESNVLSKKGETSLCQQLVFKTKCGTRGKIQKIEKYKMFLFSQIK